MWTQEQEQAIYKSGSNIIVSAGAGSGKTAVLSERVIEKIKQGINVNQLLILTFTNAASQEMKERIRKKILAAGMNNQIDLLTNAYICTFDSFSLSIVKKYHYILNIDSNVSIMDDNVNTLQISKLLDEIMDNLYSENNQDFARLITDYCIKDDKVIKEGLLNIYKKLDLLVDKDKYFANHAFINSSSITKYYEEFENISIQKIQKLYQYSLQNYDIDLSDFQNYLTTFITKKEDIHNFGKDLNLPRLKNNTDEDTKLFKEAITNEIKKIKEYIGSESKETKINQVASTIDNINTIIRIINELDQKVLEFKYKTNTYTFNDIAKMAIKIVEEHEDIKLELQNSFKEIMIDEYQDTSDIQEYFVNLIANNNVYMVGDIKQSIYRFRKANPYLFREKYDNYKVHNGGIKIDLTNNFRSRKEVVTDINNIFMKCMTKEVGDASYIEDHIMKAGNIDYNNVNANYNHTAYVLSYQNDNQSLLDAEIEAYLIAEDIKNKVDNHFQIMDKDSKEARDVRYSDFVILIDRSNNFQLYKRIFNIFKIPLTVFKDETLNDDYDIKIIINILKLLITPNIENFTINEKYEFISILRSYLYMFSDDEIYKIYCNNSYYDTELYSKIKDLRKDINSISIKEIIYRINDKFAIVDKSGLITETQKILVHLEFFAKLGETLSNIGYDLKQFVDYLDDVMDSSLSIKFKNNLTSFDDAVKIMTIHTSKGLEFGICYFPGLNNRFNLEDIKTDFLFDNKYGIIIPSVDNGKHDTIMKKILNYKAIQETISEEVRVFYVALTRAREQIIFVSKDETLKPSLTPSSFKYFVETYLDGLKNYPITEEQLNHYVSLNGEITQANIASIKENNQNIAIQELNIKKEEIKKSSFSKKINELISNDVTKVLELGTKLHNALERIDFIKPDFNIINLESKYHHYIIDFLNSDLLKNKTKGTIYKEYAFYDQINQKNGSIDLLIEYDNHIDIIDYKLKHIDDEAYDKQLTGYKEYIRSKSDKPINLYLYSIFDKKYRKL